MAVKVANTNSNKENKQKKEDLFSKLVQARKNGGSVVYVYEQLNSEGKKERIGSVVTNLGQQFLYTEKGNNRPGRDVINILQDSCHDFGADYFILEAN